MHKFLYYAFDFLFDFDYSSLGLGKSFLSLRMHKFGFGTYDLCFEIFFFLQCWVSPECKMWF